MSTQGDPLDDGDIGDFFDVAAEIAEIERESTMSLSRPVPCSADAPDDGLKEWPVERIDVLRATLQTAPWHDTSYHLHKIRNSLDGDEMVEWLKKTNFAKSTGEALAIGQGMVQRRLIHQLNRKRFFQGFSMKAGYKYTLESEEKSRVGFLAVAALKRDKSDREAGGGVLHIVDGELVWAVALERQRRPQGGAQQAFHERYLEAKDPSHFSIALDEVPVPSVGAASPDQCEWVGEWAPHVSPETDADGWRYSTSDFKDRNSFYKGDPDTDLTLHVRMRQWRRSARERARRVEIGPSSPTDKHRTEDGALADARHQELLKTVADLRNVRVARSGVLEMTLTGGQDIVKRCDSYVVVEYRDKRLKSDVAKRVHPSKAGSIAGAAASCHQWNFHCFVDMVSDLDGVKVTVFQDRIGSRTPLGLCYFYVPAPAADGGGGVLGDLGLGAGGVQDTQQQMLLMAPEKCDDKLVASAEYLGIIDMQWRFTPHEFSQENLNGALRGAGAGAAPSGPTASAAAHQPHILFLEASKIQNLSLMKSRLQGAPCGMPVRSSGPPEGFLRVKFMGSMCQMIAASPPFPMASAVAVGWRTALSVIPSSPVVIELWHNARLVPIGQITIPFKGDFALATTDADFKGPSDATRTASGSDLGSPRSGGAASMLLSGTLSVAYKWYPIDDTNASDSSSAPTTFEAAATAADLRGTNLLAKW